VKSLAAVTINVALEIVSPVSGSFRLRIGEIKLLKLLASARWFGDEIERFHD